MLLAPAAAAAPQDLQGRIKMSTGVFLGPPDPSVTQAAVVAAMVDLLDVCVSLTRESQPTPPALPWPAPRLRPAA
jgi:hypothetical protein